MATLDVQLYDYNGSIYAFGIITGYSTVKSVRMYVSDGHGNTYYYLSKQVYSQSVARINTSAYGSPSYMFHIQTNRDAETDYPEQLPYDVIDPDDSSGRGRYKLSFHFYSNNSGDSSPLNSTPLTPTSTDGNSNAWFQMHHSLTTPNISYDSENKKIRLSNVGSYRYMLEIRKKNRVNSDFTPEVRDYAYTVLMKSLEGTMGGKYTEVINGWQADWDNPVLECRYVNPWENGWSQTALVIFDSGASFSDTVKNNYLTIVKNAFSEICEIINKVSSNNFSITVDSITSNLYTKDANETVGIYVDKYGAWGGTDGEYNFIVRIGNNNTMSFGGQGFWSCYAWGGWSEGGIANSIANINIDNSRDNESISHVIHEEIYQSFNIGVDNFEQPLSIHYDPHYSNPDSYSINDTFNDDTTWDSEILKFCYSKNMNGWTPIDFINNVDTVCCLYQDTKSSSGYYEFDISGLNAGEYEVFGWVADEGTGDPGGGTWSGTTSHYNWDGAWDDAPYSIKTNIDITITSNRPDDWVWTNSELDAFNNKKSTTILTYNRWNLFIDSIQKFLEYKNQNSWTIGSNNYGYSTDTTYEQLLTNAKCTSSDKKITAQRFNIARYCIGSMNTFNVSDNNSIYNHYISTSNWDMKKNEIIYGSYFTALSEKLNEI